MQLVESAKVLVQALELKPEVEAVGSELQVQKLPVVMKKPMWEKVRSSLFPTEMPPVARCQGFLLPQTVHHP